MNREVYVAFISDRLKKEFEQLKSGKLEDKQVYYFINRAINDLKLNPTSGIKIPKSLWPKVYLQRYSITNLWKYDLPRGWRLIYTIEANDIKIMSIILEWFDHPNYERRFRY